MSKRAASGNTYKKPNFIIQELQKAKSVRDFAFLVRVRTPGI